MSGQLSSSVLRRGEPRFNIGGQRLPDILRDCGEKISAGLVARLHRYALTRMREAGFVVTNWACEVYTMDGDQRPAGRYYCVEFTNASGGMIGVQGILTSKGYPCLDHGLCVAEGRASA